MAEVKGRRLRAGGLTPRGPEGMSGLILCDEAVGRFLHRIPLSRGPADLLAFRADEHLTVAAEEDMWVNIDPV